MPIQQGTTDTWTKSSYSTGNGACVEVKSPVACVVAVRDSKDPALGTLDFRPEAWTDFVTRLGGR